MEVDTSENGGFDLMIKIMELDIRIRGFIIIKRPKTRYISANCNAVGTDQTVLRINTFGLYPPKQALNSTSNTEILPLKALILVGTSPFG